MATGIVSNALYLHDECVLADVLLAINLVAYAWLWLLALLRAMRFSGPLWADLMNPRRVFLFFTAVASTDVLGMSLGIRGFATVALSMWVFAFAMWAALIYLGLAVLMFRNSAAGDVAEGARLNGIVGTQSPVIIGDAFGVPAAAFGPQAFVLMQMLWTIGLILYGILVVLLCHRFFFAALEPDEVAPPLWVAMGAAAISVNAGTILIVDGGATPFLRSLQPFVDGVTLAAWAWATWWIPLLVLLGVWKHGIHRRPIGYAPALWSIVFPLGMHSVATYRLSGIAATPALAALSLLMAWVALAAWCGTALGLAAASLRDAKSLIVIAQQFARPAAGR
jgi:tellurite resistance protein TehA-like permease